MSAVVVENNFVKMGSACYAFRNLMPKDEFLKYLRDLDTAIVKQEKVCQSVRAFRTLHKRVCMYIDKVC